MQMIFNLLIAIACGIVIKVYYPTAFAGVETPAMLLYGLGVYTLTRALVVGLDKNLSK